MPSPRCRNPSLDGKSRLCRTCSREEYGRAGKVWAVHDDRVQYMKQDRYLADAAARELRVAQVALIVGTPLEPRLAWLRAASSELGARAPKVYSVYGSTSLSRSGGSRSRAVSQRTSRRG